MRCCSKLVIYTTRNTTLCIFCGLENTCGYGFYQLNRSQTTYNNHAPLVNVYSRRKRFDKLLMCVLRPCPQSGDDMMLEYLFNHQPIQNNQILQNKMKKSYLKDKRYCSLHLFSKLLVKNYKPPVVLQNIVFIRTMILRAFEDIEFLHSRKYPKDPFFNYCWLLSFFLEKFDMNDYTQFVKPLKCKNRRNVYATMYNELTNSSTSELIWDDVSSSHKQFFEHDDGALKNHLLL